jgi:hypothetical protein
MLSSPSSLISDRKHWLKSPFWLMLICSTLLHLGMLWIPTPAEKKAVKPLEVPKKEKTVPINQLVSLKAPAPKSRPQLKPRAKTVALRPKSARPEPVIRLKPKPAQTAPTPKTKVTATKQPVPKPTPNPESKPSTPPPPTEDTKDYSQDFQSQLDTFSSASADVKKGSDIPFFGMPEPEKFFTPDSVAKLNDGSSSEPETLPNVENVFYQANIRPDDLLDPLKETYKGFKFTEKGAFATGKMYEIRKGSTVRYVSLLKSTKGLGTFVAVWKSDPNKTQ